MLGSVNLTKNRVGWDNVSTYNSYQIYGNGHDRDRPEYVRFLRFVTGSTNSADVKVFFAKPAEAGDTFRVRFLNIPGLGYGAYWSWTCDQPTSGTVTVTVTPNVGATSATFTLTTVSTNNWFADRYMRMIIDTVTGKFEIDKDREEARIFWQAASKPPVAEISTVAADFSEATGGAQDRDCTITLTGNSIETTSQRVTLTGPLAPYCTAAGADIPALTASGTLTVSCDVDAATAGGATQGDYVDVTLDYERNTVLRTEDDFNADNYQFELTRDIHIDENNWQWSNNLAGYGHESGEEYYSALYPVFFPRPDFAGMPNAVIYDGTEVAGSELGIPQAQEWEQGQTNKELDPVTGDELYIYGPSPTATGIPYVRESFRKVFCGGPLTGHPAAEWMRMSYVVIPRTQEDANKNLEFIRVGIRIRSANRNHGVVFRSSVNMDMSDYPNTVPAKFGKDMTGADTTVWGPFDGVYYWTWRQTLPQAPQEWGVIDEDGHARLWLLHKMDPTITYTQSTGGGEVGNPNVPDAIGEFCNPIQYPNWCHPGDGSQVRHINGVEAGLNMNIVRNEQLGNMWASMLFEMSDVELTGPPFSQPSLGPSKFWPKNSITGWKPLGNATVDPAGSITVRLSLGA